MKIGFIGLGKMGSQMVHKIIQAGHEVVVLDPNPVAVTAMTSLGALASESRQDLISQLGDMPVVWIMIPAEAVGGEITELLKNLPKGSTLIDGGNTNFTWTQAHAVQCATQGVELVDIGTSGGILGLINGFSMMVGGNTEPVQAISSLLDALTLPSGGHSHFGAHGAGHFVKMVHNGIEYGMMQAYAEGYRLLKENDQYTNINLEKVAEVWQQGSIVQSNLNRLVQDIYHENPSLDGIDGYVADSGEGRWTLELADKNGVEMPVLREAIDVRVRSQNGKSNYTTKLLAAMRNAFGGHKINKS